MDEESSLSEVIRGHSRKIATLNAHIFVLNAVLESESLDEADGLNVLETLENLHESKEILVGHIRSFLFLLVKEFLLDVSKDLMDEGDSEKEFEEQVRAHALFTAVSDIIDISDWFGELDPDEA